MSDITTGDQLKAWRQSLGYTQPQAAQQLGISESWYKQLEGGHRRDDSRPVIISRTVAKACAGLLAERRRAAQLAAPREIAAAISAAIGRQGISAPDLALRAGVSLQQLDEVLAERLDQVAVAEVNRILCVLGLDPVEAAYQFPRSAALVAGR